MRWLKQIAQIVCIASCGGAAPPPSPEEAHPTVLPGALSAQERAARWALEDAEQERHLAELAEQRARDEELRQEAVRHAAERAATEERLRQAAEEREAAQQQPDEQRREHGKARRGLRGSETTDEDSEPAGGSGYCCKICTTGCACGNTCISCSKTCHVGAGCACDG